MELSLSCPREDVIAARPTRAFDDKWAKGFVNPDAFTGIVYDGLAKARPR